MDGKRRRSQAERDAMTVEIGYALCTGVFLGAAVFGLFALPALAALPPSSRSALFSTGGVAACCAFLVRVVTVLARFGRRQPSRPGHTHPDA